MHVTDHGFFSNERFNTSKSSRCILIMVDSDSTASPPEWTLLYHSPGTIKGRGEFLRLMFADAGISYVYYLTITYVLI